MSWEAYSFMMKIKGKISYRAIATGTWIIVTEKGDIYELYNSPQEILKDGLAVLLEGKIREDIMTVAMVGKVFEVISYSYIM